MSSRLSSLFEGLEEVHDRDRALANLTLDRLARTDSELATVARIAAVPRQIDAEIIGVLRDDRDMERNEALLGQLASLSFVERRHDGGLVYHDSVRRALIDELREGEREKEFLVVGARLRDFYVRRHDVVYGRYADVKRVAAVLRSANPQRLQQVLDVAERSLIPSSLEVLYHATLLEPAEGYRVFETLFSFYERDGLLAACRELIIGIRTFLQESSQPTLKDKEGWLRYREGRVELRLGHPIEAEGVFREVLASATDDPTLQKDVLGSLVQSLEQQSRLREARDFYLEQLRLLSGDPNELRATSFAFAGVAHLELRLGELDQAAEALRHAIELAGQARDSSLLAMCNAFLGVALVEMGQTSLAREHLFTAIDLSRDLDSVPEAAAAAQTGLNYLLKRSHARVVDTLAAEMAALKGEPTAPSAELDRFVDAWQTARAEDILSDHPFLLDSPPPGPAGADLLSAVARLRDQQGRFDEASEYWGAVVAGSEVGDATPEQVAIALTNRGVCELRLRRLAEACTYLLSAREAWQTIGHIAHAVLTDVNLAEAEFIAGRLDDAERLLANSEDGARRHPNCQASHDYLQGRVLRQRGQMEAALQVLDRSARTFHAVGALDGLSRVLADRAATAGEVPNWEVMGISASWAADLATELNERSSYRPSAEAIECDLLNAKAMRLYYRLDASEDALEEATQLLRKCVAREPLNFWYRLNLAYTCAAGHHWREAVQHFDAVVDLEPQLLSNLAPQWRAVMALVAAGDSILGEGEVAAALQLYGDAEGRLRVLERPAQSAAVLIRIGDALVAGQRAGEAEATYRKAESVAASAGALDSEAAAATRRGVLLAARGHDLEARGLLQHALTICRAAGSTRPYWDVVSDCSRMPEPYRSHESLARLLRELRDSPETGAVMSNFKPRLSATLPSDWGVKESLTLLSPDGNANVMVSSEPIDPAMTTEQYAEVQGGLLREQFPGYEEHTDGTARFFGERNARVRRFSWHPPDGVRVTQIQVYFVEDGRSYTATATTPYDHFPVVELELQEILKRLLIGDR